MALALDASTPTAVTSTVSTSPGVANNFTTASFTPPVGACIVVCFGLNAGGNAGNVTSGISVTDNLGTHLTYTQVQKFGNTISDVISTVWKSSPVLSAVSMTVTASYTDSNGQAGSATILRVLVFTGANTTNPVGASGGARGRTTNISGTAAQYTSTVGDSWGWLLYSDWSQSGVPTVPASETVDASYDVVSSDTYAVIKANATTPTPGTTVTLTTSTPSASLQLSFVYFEVVPAPVGPTIGSVPSGTAIARGSFSAKFLYFDTGDFSSGA